MDAIAILSNEINWQVLKKDQELLLHIINNYTMEVIDTRWGCQNPQGSSKGVSDKLMQETFILHNETEIH